MKKMEREKDEMDLDRKIDKNVCKEIKNIERQWNKSSREEKNEANILGNRWKQINT